MDEKTLHRIYLEQQEQFRELRRKLRKSKGGKSEEQIRMEMENPNVYTPPSMININLDNSDDVDIE